MAHWVGPRITAAEVAATEGIAYLEPEESTSSILVRAWWLDRLHGVHFTASGRDDIPRALTAMLTTALGDWPWEVDPHVLEVFDRYWMIHAHTPAPTDETTDQPLEIEVYAEPVGSDRSLTFTVVAATCSNVRHLGVGMPFYS